MSIVGTRPEAIKIAPIALEAAKRSALTHIILATGQHGAPFNDALAAFGLGADMRLGPLLPAPHPDVMTQRMVAGLRPLIATVRPDMVLVLGDTSSAVAGTMAAHDVGIPVVHVEAGLRSHDFDRPWPEERNRVAIDRLSALCCAPSSEAVGNLLDDRHIRGRIVLTGNSGIDALMWMRERVAGPDPQTEDRPGFILLTCHRRENIGEGIDAICTAARRIADRGDVGLLCPVHPNPAVSMMIRARLSSHPAIQLTGPLGYRETVQAMAASRLILTDSGGIQEEAPALGIPTLVLRSTTERPEGVVSGNLRLVGTDPDHIFAVTCQLLDDPFAHARMSRPSFPFGRGDASAKILDAIEQYFSSGPVYDHPLPSARLWIMDGARKGA